MNGQLAAGLQISVERTESDYTREQRRDKTAPETKALQIEN